MNEPDFDELAWRGTCKRLFAQACRNSGLSYDACVSSFSWLVDAELAQLPSVHRKRALDLAREWDYATPEELAQVQLELAASGYCSHGIEWGCCPAGC